MNSWHLFEWGFLDVRPEGEDARTGNQRLSPSGIDVVVRRESFIVPRGVPWFGNPMHFRGTAGEHAWRSEGSERQEPGGPEDAVPQRKQDIADVVFVDR